MVLEKPPIIQEYRRTQIEKAYEHLKKCVASNDIQGLEELRLIMAGNGDIGPFIQSTVAKWDKYQSEYARNQEYKTLGYEIAEQEKVLHELRLRQTQLRIT